MNGVVQVKPGEWLCLCPTHDDHEPSLLVTEAEDGKVVICCRAGCVTPPIVYSAQLTMRDLFPDHGKSAADKKKPKGKIVAKYDYLDSDGAVLFQVCRMDPKDFRQRRPDGTGGWVWNLKGVARVLYRLPQLLAADKLQPVLVIEGEKDVDRLIDLGFIATTNMGGAGKWRKDYSKHLEGRDVVVVPDNDQPGRDHAAGIVLALSGIAKSVKVLPLPDLPAKGDASDWLNSGGTAEKLRELIGSTAEADAKQIVEQKAAEKTDKKKELESLDPADPALLAKDREILASIRLDVLGELGEGKAKAFSEVCRKSAVLDIDRITYDRMLMLCGPIFRAMVQKGQGVDDDDRPTLSTVRNAIATVASTRQITDHDEVGVGCWTGLTDDLKAADSIILVGAGEAAKWNGTKQLEKILRPRVGGLLLELGAAEHWYDFDKLASLMQEAGDPIWSYSVVLEAEELFARWRWKNQMITPKVIVGLILATWVQTIFSWRPLVAITGKSNSGKSTLFEALDGIFGNLALKSSRSSAAGIRQAVKRSAAVVMVDEFEAGRNREESLEMFRASSRGDKVLRGTTGHKGMEFTLRHIVWVAAIESGLTREPDRNRFITLEAQTPTPEMAGKLILPPSHLLNELGVKLLAVAVRNALTARELAVKLKVERFPGIHPRVVESYAVPAAMYAGVQKVGQAEAVGILRDLLATVDTGDSTDGDEETLIGDILSSVLRIDRGTEYTVSQALAAAKSSMEADEALQRSGIDVVKYNEITTTKEGNLFGEYLFIAHTVVKRHLLKGTNWTNQSIDQILCRFPGAVRQRIRIANMRPNGVLIPMSSVESLK